MCLNGDNSDQATWYKKMKGKIGQHIFHRKLHESSDAQNTRETEIFLKHVRALCCALARANTKEGARRKFGIKTLWAACGRGGEPGMLSLEGMRWNELLECVAVESPQSKPSKLKFAVFMAGADHLSDWVLDFGDMLVWEKGNRTFSADTKTWLLPELSSASSSSTTLTDWVKALQPGNLPGALQRYAPVAISRDRYGVELPPAPTAKGFRHGACDTICIGVPAELAVHNTGHDLTNLGALFEYLNSRVPLCVPGALLLFGWPSHPYGQTGDGSKFPSLEVLVRGGVSIVRLEALIDELFCFHDASPPMLLVDGPLRPLMHAALATQIMYYETRFKAKPTESTHVLERMRDAYDAIMSTPGHDAHSVLIEWGKSLERQFKIDNASLRDRSKHEPSEQMVASIQGLGTNVGRMHTQLSDLAQRTISLEQQNQALLLQNQQIMQLVLQQQRQLAQLTATGTPAAPLPAAPAPAAPAPATANDLPPRPPQPGPVAPVPITPLAGSPSERAFMHATASAESSAVQHQPKARDFGAQSSYELKDLQATQFLLDCMERGCNVPANLSDERRRPEAEGVFTALKAMCNSEEKSMLMMKGRDAGQQAHAVSIATAIVQHLVQRILRAYADKADRKGPGRLPQTVINKVLVNTLDRHLKQSGLNVSSSAFASWRNDPSAKIVGPMAAMLGGKKRARPDDEPVEVSGSDSD